MIIYKTRAEIEKMRVAGRIVAETLQALKEAIRPGKTTTWDLDALAAELLASKGARASFKGYRGFPATICVALNEEVVHGIPGPRVVESGDILGIDLGAIVDGYHGDAAVTIPIGKVSEEARRLLRVTREALHKGIEKARVGNTVSDISHAIQCYVENNGCSVVRDLVGHGIGREMHEEPPVPNFGKPHRGAELKEGMTLAIEPMVNLGGHHVESMPDKWTVVTRDRSLSAHFEHAVAVTSSGPDILTLLGTGEEVNVDG